MAADQEEVVDTITHARNELMRTFADLAVLIPGLQVSILLSVPIGNDAAVSFFTNQDQKQALILMTKVIAAGHRENLIVSSSKIPEAT